MELWSADSTQKHYATDTWGTVSCSGSGYSKNCWCSKGSVATVFEAYTWNWNISDKGYGYQRVCLVSNSADGEKPIGGCTEFWDPQSKTWDLCKLAWGDGYCSGNTCSCSTGSVRTVMEGVFAWDSVDSDWTYSYKYYCVV
jgi:hypothetical protein